MAKNRGNIQAQRERLRVKAAQMDARLKLEEYKDKVKQLSGQLRTMGGRIR